MSRAAKSLWVFGVYMLGLGWVLVLVPNLLLQVVGLPRTQEVWIRVIGVLVLILGCYDLQAARTELKPFFRCSVYVRVAVPFFFAIFAGLGMVKPVLIAFGAADFFAALWTYWALRKDGF